MARLDLTRGRSWRSGDVPAAWRSSRSARCPTRPGRPHGRARAGTPISSFREPIATSSSRTPASAGALWTPRVWPGGLLLGGELAGTWRRAGAVLTVQPWRRLSRAERDAVVAEAESLPLPGPGRIAVRWVDPAASGRPG